MRKHLLGKISQTGTETMFIVTEHFLVTFVEMPMHGEIT